MTTPVERDGEEPSTFSAALAARSDDDLAALLRRRPDVAVPPPADFDVLASRLSSTHSVNRAAETVDQFVLEVLEVLALEPRTEAELADFTGVDLIEVARAVDAAEELALLWRAGDGRLHVASGVAKGVGGYPLGLGRPIASMLRGVPRPIVEQIRTDLQLRSTRPAEEAIAEAFSRPERVRDVVARLGAAEQDILHQLAAGPPVGEIDGEVRFVPAAEAETVIEVLLALGLLVALDVNEVELPREVGIALRGERPAGELHPSPPLVAGARVDAADADADGASSVLEAIRLTEALLERWDAEPPTLTRAGGLPVRELRGAAKALGVAQETVALLIQLASVAQLTGRTPGIDPSMVPTEQYDRWRDEPLADRWALLATSWLGMNQLPGLAVRADGTKGAALLTYEMVRQGSSELRRDVLAAIAAAGPGHAADRDQLAPWLAWRSPTRSTGYVQQMIAWTLEEARFLGVTGRGALTTAGRVLIESGSGPAARTGDEVAARTFRSEVGAAVAPSLPEPIEHVLIQADLTAVAPGPLLPPVARELALLADVESAGTATVYRFSEASLRRAFDLGRTATAVHQLINELARGKVPQALTYLIDDIARRHGRMRAGAAGGYLRSDDPALLAEVVANRQTAAAGLHLIAPTVAVSPLDPSEILAVLRKAGYAPAGESAARASRGTIDLERPRNRVPVSGSRTPAAGWGAGQSLPANHIAQTVKMLRRVAALRRPGRKAGGEPDPERIVDTPGAILAVLREAAEESAAVWISYVNSQGRPSRRTIYPTLVSAGHVVALDDESGERRTFAISHIQQAAYG
jgi:hypothetical protein